MLRKDGLFLIMEENEVKSVLEFGSGLSSLLMSETATVLSFEMNQEHADNVLERVNGNQLSIRIWDGVKPKSVLGRFDLAFVDGPVGVVNGGPGREHSIRLAAEHADRVIVHDAGRREETHWQNQILRPHFKLVGSSGQHHSRCHYWERRRED